MTSNYLSVSVDLEVSDDDMPAVLHALEAFGDGPGDGGWGSLNGHSGYSDPTAM